MDMLLNSILLNTDAQGSGMMQIVMIVLLIAVFYFFMIRPQNKKQKEIKKAYRKVIKLLLLEVFTEQSKK